MDIIVSDLFSIAIDGPVAVGKTVVAKVLAKKLGFIYLDTGLMYRAVTYTVLQHNLDFRKESQIIDLIGKLRIWVESSEDVQKVIVSGEDVSNFLRLKSVEENVSYISSIRQVRSILVELQREIARNNSIVMIGRDIGTVVLPKADLKIFLTAPVRVRAARRFKETEHSQDKIDFENILDDIQKRDLNDSTRLQSPLKKAVNAIVLDTNDKTVEEVVSLIVELMK